MKAKKIRQIQSKLFLWYKKNQRPLPWRETDDPYCIWVSEVMLQQTQVNTVLPYYRTFFLHFPNVQSLAQADINDVLKVWEGMGYYARARNLHQAAKTVVEKHKGKIPGNWHDFRRLSGVGEYIASAVLSIAFHKPYAVVDGNVKRVLARLLQIDAAVNKSASYKIFKEASETLLDSKQPGIFNQAIMELGALICKSKNPNCGICPVQPFCRAYQFQTLDEYPKRIKKPPRPEYHIAVGVVFKNTHVLITRRKLEGLLGGLWEFPGGKVRKRESAKTACVREIQEEVNISVEVSSFLTRVKHAYTHFKIHADVFCCKYLAGNVQLNGPIDYLWIKLQDIDQYPFPKANHKFIPLLKIEKEHSTKTLSMEEKDMKIPKYVTVEEVKRVCKELKISDWTKKKEPKVSLKEAKIILAEVYKGKMKIDPKEFQSGLEVELEHGLQFKDANVTNNHPLLTGLIVLAHFKESLDYYRLLEVAELEGDLLKAVVRGQTKKIKEYYARLAKARISLSKAELKRLA